MKPSEVLRKARALIEKPENWTQGAYARDALGAEVDALNNAAARWSASGAIRAQNANYYWTLRELERWVPLGWRSAESFNDTHTHSEVLSLFDRAIAAAEARGE